MKDAKVASSRKVDPFENVPNFLNKYGFLSSCASAAACRAYVLYGVAQKA